MAKQQKNDDHDGGGVVVWYGEQFRNNMGIKKILRLWWTSCLNTLDTDGNKEIDREEYLGLYKRLCYGIAYMNDGKVDDDDLIDKDMMNDDWIRDSGGKMALDEECFSNAIFELAQAWAGEEETLQAFQNFLKDLHHICFVMYKEPTKSLTKSAVAISQKKKTPERVTNSFKRKSSLIGNIMLTAAATSTKGVVSKKEVVRLRKREPLKRQSLGKKSETKTVFKNTTFDDDDTKLPMVTTTYEEEDSDTSNKKEDQDNTISKRSMSFLNLESHRDSVRISPKIDYQKYYSVPSKNNQSKVSSSDNNNITITKSTKAKRPKYSTNQKVLLKRLIIIRDALRPTSIRAQVCMVNHKSTSTICDRITSACVKVVQCFTDAMDFYHNEQQGNDSIDTTFWEYEMNRIVTASEKSLASLVKLLDTTMMQEKPTSSSPHVSSIISQSSSRHINNINQSNNEVKSSSNHQQQQHHYNDDDTLLPGLKLYTERVRRNVSQYNTTT